MNTNTTDKVQVGDSTTTTSTTWHCPYIKPKAEQGWECPRCGHINAPWVRQCDCSNTWTINTTWGSHPPQNDDWWKTYITCQQADNITSNPNIYQVGGSDYKEGNTYVNVGGTQSNSTPNSTTTAWKTYSTNTIHNGKTNYKE